MTTELTLILPGVLPPRENRETLGIDLLRQLELPALEKLLARMEPAVPSQDETHDDAYLPSLPHERWLAAMAGLSTSGPSLPTAPYMRLAARTLPGKADSKAPASTASTSTWACLQPVHIHAARDHLVLVDPALLDLQADEAEALHETIRPILAELGMTLDLPLPGHWFVSGETFGMLEAATPARAIGRNIDLWMQAGERAREWRRFQNEVQMIWFDHPVNQAREAAGRPTVNSVWLHGTGALQKVAPLADVVWADDLFARGLALSAGTPANPAPTALSDCNLPPGRALIMLDHASSSSANGDWATWLDIMRRLEADWFAPALVALGAGQIQKLQLVVSNDTHVATRTIMRTGLRKFWRGLRSSDWRQRWLTLGGKA
ncbi:MAG TPA: hypothetical protein VM512_10005 [Burkholderiaceae bacterium]|nr:hypothetical protein [Burkholderiaceae bacterium]